LGLPVIGSIGRSDFCRIYISEPNKSTGSSILFPFSSANVRSLCLRVSANDAEIFVLPPPPPPLTSNNPTGAPGPFP